jgi:hypothetical protein
MRVLLVGKIGNQGQEVVQLDPSTHSIVTTTYPHSEIHKGNAFKSHWYNTTLSADNARSLIGFKTPSGDKAGHMVATIYASHPANFAIMEGPTIDLSEGNEIPIFNRNRNSDKTSIMQSLETVPEAGFVTTMLEAEVNGANYSGGLEIDYTILVGGQGPFAVGGTHRGDEEWLLKTDTIYTFEMKNIGANINLHFIHLGWYEHTPRD